jgi:hypothetical protein
VDLKGALENKELTMEQKMDSLQLPNAILLMMTKPTFMGHPSTIKGLRGGGHIFEEVEQSGG